MKDPTQLDADELKSWLRDHLQMKGSAALAIDVRHDESPFEKPAALWKSGDAPFRERLLQTVLDFLMEAAEGSWSPEPFHQLCFLIEACPLQRIEPALEDFAHSRRLLRLDAGAQLHMLTLRTLLGLGWKGSPSFWSSQRATIANRWPSIIFEGLAQHGLPLAFDALPDLVRDPQAMRDILNLFPSLMRTLHVSINEMANEAGRISEDLRPAPKALLREWFSLRALNLQPTKKPNNYASLTNALSRVLNGDITPRSRTAMPRSELQLAA